MLTPVGLTDLHCSDKKKLDWTKSYYCSWVD